MSHLRSSGVGDADISLEITNKTSTEKNLHKQQEGNDNRVGRRGKPCTIPHMEG